jgi:hypothetical protein
MTQLMYKLWIYLHEYILQNEMIDNTTIKQQKLLKSKIYAIQVISVTTSSPHVSQRAHARSDAMYLYASHL